jgi:hypothetical protein
MASSEIKSNRGEAGVRRESATYWILRTFLLRLAPLRRPH